MGTGASISAADVPEQVTAEVAERLVGSSVWETTGRAYFDDNKPDNRDHLTREQFLDFVRLEQQKARRNQPETELDSSNDSKPKSKKKSKKTKKKKSKNVSDLMTEAEMLKKIERKKRRKLMRIQKAKAAQELLAAAEDAATAEHLREQYETDTAALERDIALQKEKMKEKLAQRRAKSQKARLRKVQQRKLAKVREVEKSAADELARRLEAIREDYAKEKALAVENDGNLVAIRNKYEADVQAARRDAVQAKHEQVKGQLLESG